MADTPSVRNGAQRSENTRKNSVLNYESPALTAELQARISDALKHNTSLRPTRKAPKVS
jgi:hypothetical protein